MTGPDPNKIHPNENIQQIVYIKNVITRPNIIVGEYSYYDDVNGARGAPADDRRHVGAGCKCSGRDPWQALPGSFEPGWYMDV